MAKAKAVPTYNMTDLSGDVAENFGLTQASGSDITRFIFDRIKKEVAAGKPVRLHQFGTLKASKRKARKAHNPKTGVELRVPAHRVVKLVPSPAFKQQLK